MSWLSLAFGFLAASGLGGSIVAAVNHFLTVPAARLKGLPAPLAAVIEGADTLLVHTIDGKVAAVTGITMASVPVPVAPTLAQVAETAAAAATSAANTEVNRVLPALLATPARHIVDGVIAGISEQISANALGESSLPVKVTPSAPAAPAVTETRSVAPTAALPTLKPAITVLPPTVPSPATGHVITTTPDPLTPLQTLQAQQSALAVQIADAQAAEKAALQANGLISDAPPTDSPPPFSGV